MNREIVAKLKLPMPINEGLKQVTEGLQQIYGPCYCGGQAPSMHEDGWWIIWREAKEPPSPSAQQRPLHEPIPKQS